MIHVIYTCGVCRFTFERTGEIDACPDCGKQGIRAATATEIAEFRRNREDALDMRLTLDAGPLLAARGIAPGELAERAGVSPETVQAMCDGSAADFSLSEMDRICEVLDCAPTDIIHKSSKWQMME